MPVLRSLWGTMEGQKGFCGGESEVLKIVGLQKDEQTWAGQACEFKF